MSAATFAGEMALPCPFCGCADTMFYSVHVRLTEFWFVSCLNVDCECSGPRDLGKSGAIEKWNEAKRLNSKGESK